MIVLPIASEETRVISRPEGTSLVKPGLVNFASYDHLIWLRVGADELDGICGEHARGPVIS